MGKNPMIKVDEKNNLESIRMLCNRQNDMPEHYRISASKNVYGPLVGLFNKALEDTTKENRLRVVSKFIGREIPSFERLTVWEAKTLLDVLLDTSSGKWDLTEEGARLITYAELYDEIQSEDGREQLESIRETIEDNKGEFKDYLEQQQKTARKIANLFNMW